MNSKIATSKSAIAKPVLDTMTREDLAATAKALNVPVGKSKANTVANLCKAIDNGKAHFKAQCTLSFKPDDGSASRTTYYGATLRTYVSGPGKGNEVWLTPATATPGSPADQNDLGQ